MACEPVIYSSVDASKWACVKDAVSQAHGLSIESDVGEGSARGFTLSWRYDATEQSLFVQCSRKPFIVSCGMVKKRLDDEFEQCGILAPDRV